MGLEVILLIFSSLFLEFQGLATSGILGSIERFVLSGIDSNYFVASMLGLRIATWGIILGVIGIVISIVGVLDSKIIEKEKVSRKSYIPFIVLYFVLAILSLL